MWIFTQFPCTGPLPRFPASEQWLDDLTGKALYVFNDNPEREIDSQAFLVVKEVRFELRSRKNVLP